MTESDIKQPIRFLVNFQEWKTSPWSMRGHFKFKKFYRNRAAAPKRAKCLLGFTFSKTNHLTVLTRKR